MQRDPKKKRMCCIIDPDSKTIRPWNILMVTLLMAVAIWTPVEVSFMEPKLWGVLFWLNRFVDLAFSVDMVIMFFLPYPDPKTNKRVKDHYKIAKHYLRGWFLIDLVSVIPFDIFSEVSNAPKDLRISRMSRVIRLLRLVKLLKVIKGMALFRLPDWLVVSHSVQSLTRCFLGVVVMAHWSGCTWHLIGTVYDERHNWIVAYGIQDAQPLEKYAASFYWAVMTLTTIGYGDVAANNPVEQLVSSMLMLIGGGIYAYVVGQICEIFSSMDLEKTDHNAAVDQLNSMLEQMSVPSQLRKRLRNYFKNCKGMHKEKYSRSVIDMMSPGLQREYTATCFKNVVASIGFLDLAEIKEETAADFKGELVLMLRDRYFPAQEQIIRFGEIARHMYIVRQGLVGIHGKIRRRNTSFGNDVICGGRREYLATTLTFTCVMSLAKDDLLALLQEAGYEKIQKRVFGKGRWLRVKGGLLEFVRTYSALCEVGKDPQNKVQFAWRDRSKAQLTVSLNGVRLKQFVSSSHLNLLRKFDEVTPALSNFLDNPGGIRVEAGSSQLFRREVVVGEMGETDLSLILADVCDGKLQGVNAQMENIRSAIAELDALVDAI